MGKTIGGSFKPLLGEEQYRLLFETANDAIFILDNDTFTECNEKALQMFGCSRERLIGHKPWEFSPQRQPDGRLSTRKAPEFIKKAMAGDPQVFEWTHTRLDGTPFDTEVSLNAMRLEEKILVQAIVRDITRRKQTEEALRRAQEKYQNIFENAVEGIYQTTPEGRFITANKTLARMIGYDSPEAMIAGITDIGKQIYVNPDRRLEYRRLVEENGLITGFEFQHYRKDGSVIWVSLNARAVRDDDGKLLYYEGRMENITERKRAEEALENERRTFFAIFEKAPYGVVLTDSSGNFLYANPEFTAITGYTLTDVPIGRDWFAKAYPDEVYVRR